MSSEWQQFLQQQGARLDEGGVRNFGDAVAELQHSLQGDILCPILHQGLLRASGTDTATFLQGQTSNDVRHVDGEHHQLNSYCTPKGRILTLFRLFQRGDDYFLQLPQQLLAATQKRLTMYILRSQVILTDASGELPCLGLAGPNAPQLLQQQLGIAPTEVGEALTHNEVTVLRIPGETPRFLLFAPVERAISLWQSLTPAARPVGAPCWQLQEIQAGLPSVVEATVEAFVPQMLNLQLVDGVNFKKGCYPGQEVVARMQYLGKLKRRMYRARSNGDEPPKAGDELFSPVSESGQGSGKVVAAAPAAEGGHELLVVAEIAGVEQGALYLGDATGPRLELLPLPYPFS